MWDLKTGRKQCEYAMPESTGRHGLADCSRVVAPYLPCSTIFARLLSNAIRCRLPRHPGDPENNYDLASMLRNHAELACPLVTSSIVGGEAESMRKLVHADGRSVNHDGATSRSFTSTPRILALEKG